MSDFECPDCGGGFPKDTVYGDLDTGAEPACPWCERDLLVISMAHIQD